MGAPRKFAVAHGDAKQHCAARFFCGAQPSGNWRRNTVSSDDAAFVMINNSIYRMPIAMEKNRRLSLFKNGGALTTISKTSAMASFVRFGHSAGTDHRTGVSGRIHRHTTPKRRSDL